MPTQTRIKWCFILTLALFFWYGNHLTPYLADDYGMCEFRGLDFIDAIISSINVAKQSYMAWGGAIFWAVIQRFFLNYPKWTFNIVNAIHMAIFLYAIYTLIEKKNTINYLPIIICVVTLLLIPVPTQTLFWEISAIAYFWPIVWSFILLLIYDRSNGRNIRIYYIIIPPLALLCGNAHGALGGMILIVTVGYQFFWKFSQGKKNPFWSIAGCACTLIGILIMVFSPGIKHRAVVSGGRIGLGKVVFQMANLVREQSFLVSLLAIAIIFLWRHSNDYRNEHFVKANIYAFAAFAGMGALLLVPAAVRASLFFPCFALIAIGFIISHLLENKKMKIPFAETLFVVTFMFLVKFFSLYNDANKVKNIATMRESHIFAEKQAGKHEIIVPNMSSWSIYQRFTSGLTDLGNCEDDWQNQGMASFYGVKRIIGQDIFR